MIFVQNLETMTLIKIYILMKELLFLVSTSCKLKKNIKKKHSNKKDFGKDTIVLILEIF